MSPQLSGAFVFAIIALPVAFAWHTLVERYLTASLLASGNIIFLTSCLLVFHRMKGPYIGTMLLLMAVAACTLSFGVGLVFLFARRKKKDSKKQPIPQ